MLRRQIKGAVLDDLRQLFDNRDRRNGSLVTRLAACRLLAITDKRNPAAVAAQHWPHDTELRAAVGPARTDTAGWAAELVAVMIADITGSLLGPSVVRATARIERRQL